MRTIELNSYLFYGLVGLFVLLVALTIYLLARPCVRSCPVLLNVPPSVPSDEPVQITPIPGPIDDNAGSKPSTPSIGDIIYGDMPESEFSISPISELIPKPGPVADPSAIKARYVIFGYFSGHAGELNIAEMEVYDEYGQLISPMAIPSSNYKLPGFSPPLSNLNDNDHATFTLGGFHENSHFVLDFGHEVSISKVAIINRRDSGAFLLRDAQLVLKNTELQVVFSSKPIMSRKSTHAYSTPFVNGMDSA